ncbi:MAG: helix-turn-helix transcriptional regulator [Legionellales bacterium]|jgi:transcriptional regulator with XRE-family HTH domain
MSTKKTRATPKSDKTITTLEKIAKIKLTLGSFIWSIREGEEMSQREFGKLLGVSSQYICDIEHGRKIISPKAAAEFAEKLGYSPLQFVKLALQSELDQYGLDFKVDIKAT